MKRFISILLVFLALLALCACEGEIVNQTTTSTTTTKLVTTTTKPTTDTTTTTENTTETTTENPTTTTTLPRTTKSTTRFSTVTQSNFHAPLEPSIFDDAVFVGDSVTNNLRLYLGRQNNKGNYPLGKAKLLCAASLSYTNALWAVDRPGNVHPTFEGKKVRVPDGVKKSGAKKVFIMLGMNDFIIYGADKTVQNAQTLINQILALNPDVTIYVQSVTPILRINEEGNKTNANVRKVNQKLKAMCDKNGWIYLDVASVLIDENGNLSSAYCIDPGVNGMGIHINDYACKKWVEYLCSNVIAPEPEPPTTTTTKPTTTTQTTTVTTTVTTTATTTATTQTTTTLPEEIM